MPYLVEEEDIETLRTQLEEGGLRFPFPNIGDHRPEGYELEGMMMVDSSGLGADWEPALTHAQLIERLEVGKAHAIIEVGQFQVVLGEFQKA